MADAGTPEPQGTQPGGAPQLNTSKAPQQVEVVVESPSSQGEINISAELAIFLLRLGFSVMMFHHGLESYFNFSS